MPTPLEWRKLDRTPQSQQQKFFLKYADKFEYKPVKRLGDVEEGSHLRVKGSSNATFGYHHHFVCTRKSRDKITVMENNGPDSGIFPFSKCSICSECAKVAGTIKSKDMSIEDIEKQQAGMPTYAFLSQYPCVTVSCVTRTVEQGGRGTRAPQYF